MSTPKTMIFAIVATCVILGNGQYFGDNTVQADTQDDKLITDHYFLEKACSSVLNEQISLELYASIVYMNMAAHFNRPTVARPGYGKFFKEQSAEEYAHASKFIEYINLRNGTVKMIAVKQSPKSEWGSPKEALNDAIKLEKHVYAKLRHIHDVADQKCQDPHLMDFLESNFFTEQVDSISEMLRLMSTLDSGEESISVIEHLEDKRLSKEL